MKRDEAISRLRAHAEEVKRQGATQLWLFGSTARDEAKARSDIDVFIEYDPLSKFNVLDLLRIRRFLTQSLKKKVDLTTRDGLHPMLRKRIEREAVRVF